MRTLVIGIGSTILSDDGVGVRAARRLNMLPRPRGVDVAELGTAGFALLDLVQGYDRLIVLDAMVTGALPGAVRVLTGGDIAASVHGGPDHETDLATTLAMGGRILGRRMPSEVVVVAVEAADITTFSENLTPEVEAALPDAVAAVLRLVR